MRTSAPQSMNTCISSVTPRLQTMKKGESPNLFIGFALNPHRRMDLSRWASPGLLAEQTAVAKEAIWRGVGVLMYPSSEAEHLDVTYPRDSRMKSR
mmetsp:Transcript_24956/g.42456  ORF Transcript_24956/g.42456 Transcript_24956/m.42456 type:complete len:96 (+) Transcript_24956:465-752(+)